jgi:transposase
MFLVPAIYVLGPLHLRHRGPQGPAGSGGEKSRPGRRRGLKGLPGRGTLEKEKPPIFGMVERGGAVVLHRLANVRQVTIKPLILGSVALGSLINTDEDAIYGRLPEWGFGHKTVNHGRGEDARDEDGDGFCEVHVNSMEVRRCGAD